MTLTSSDLKEIKNLIDNADLKNIKQLIEITFDEKLEEKLELKLNQKLEEKLKFIPSTELFLSWMDKLMGEIKDSREEQTMLLGRQSDHSDRIEELEKIHPQGKHFAQV